MDISEKLRYYRKQNNLTQKDLADQLHLSRKTISAWENGRGYPDINSVTQLSDIFGISTDDLLRDNGLLEHYAEQSKQHQRAIKVTKLSYFLNIFLLLMCYGHIFDFINVSSSIFLIFLVGNMILFASSYADWDNFKNKKRIVTTIVILVVLLVVNALIVPLNTNFFELLKVDDQAEKLGVIVGEFIILIILSLGITLAACFYPRNSKTKKTVNNSAEG